MSTVIAYTKRKPPLLFSKSDACVNCGFVDKADTNLCVKLDKCMYVYVYVYIYMYTW